MTHHTDAELLPCPFCGCKAEAKKPDMSYEFTLIKCQECDAQSDERIDLEDAAEAWNRRAPAAPVPLRKPTIDQVADAVGYHDSAWDCVDPIELIDAILMLAAAPQPPEAEENPLQEPLDEALQSLEFYKRRCDLLQSIQPRMRDPERTMVCDVLANGNLLQGGDGQPDKARYAPPEAAPVQLPEPVAYQWLSTDNFRISGGPVSGAYWNKLYTEQQVRELLAANGIKVNQ